MSSEVFGILADGTEIPETTITSGKLTARLINWGAVLRDLRLDGHQAPLVLGLTSLDDYVAHSPHMGAMAGRFANRIGNGRFQIDGTPYQVDLNEKGRTHLHGGRASFARRPWDLVLAGSNFATFALKSSDGESGYPGTVTTTVTYRVEAPANLVIVVQAETTAPTLVSIAHHSYFCLDDGPTCSDTLLEIDAEAYTPVNDLKVPTGDVQSVAGTAFDFRRIRPIGNPEQGYDHNYCLAAMPRMHPAFAAMATSPRSGITMEVWTTEPGVQFYDGANVSVPVAGLDGRLYGAHAGFCLEPQRWPDAPNHRHFPSATLRPGQTYQQRSEFRFSQTPA